MTNFDIAVNGLAIGAAAPRTCGHLRLLLLTANNVLADGFATFLVELLQGTVPNSSARYFLTRSLHILLLFANVRDVNFTVAVLLTRSSAGRRDCLLSLANLLFKLWTATWHAIFAVVVLRGWATFLYATSVVAHFVARKFFLASVVLSHCDLFEAFCRLL